MGTKAVKQRKISFLYVAAIIIFAAYVLIRIFSYQVSINAQAAENEEISKQIAEQEAENDELEALINSNDMDAYIERVAREKYGYAASGERVYSASDAS